MFQEEIFRFFSGIVNEDYQRYVGICVKTDDNGNVLTRGNGDSSHNVEANRVDP